MTSLFSAHRVNVKKKYRVDYLTRGRVHLGQMRCGKILDCGNIIAYTRI